MHVSGAAALWLAFHDAKLDPYADKPWQRVEAFRHCLVHSARKPARWDSALFGAGILDMAALLDVPLPAPDTLTYNERRAAKERI